MKRISIGKIILLIAMTTLLIGLVGCSDVSKDGKKAFKAVEKYQKEHYPVSNKELEIVYPKLKDMSPFVEGRSTAGNDTWQINGVYTFNPEKVEDLGHEDPHPRISYEAHIELIDGEYIVTGYTESLPIRGDLDD
ncbi:hypothetical protein [Pseudogracilibacillus sp. SO10305]|uniref:hypothetical protein n=1 Tax=Pseudogracilibacillus sp. SO10305 TaxID=3098292 RepID=UPI00300E0BE6